MLREMTSQQFLGWLAYEAVEPFDETRADLRAASIVQAILNVNRGKNTPPYKLEDLVLRFGEAPKKQDDQPSWKKMRILAEMIAAANAK